MEKVITVMAPTRSRHTLAPLNAPTLRRVAGYARVSTDSEEQENSYEAQVTHYTEFIKNHEGWAFAGMYTDDGVSGTGTERRAGFNQMIQDALAGKFTLIVTKSISRWARNTVDSLTTIRELKAHGCEVFFEKENIFTFDGKGEILVTLMSSLAQEESRSISENTTWGIRQGFSKGKVFLPYGNFLGYKKGADGPEIEEKGAEVVRTIYRRFLEGETPVMIAKALEKAGVPSPTGKKKWYDGTVQSILQNEKYNGSAILQKTFTTDFLTHKKKKNEGELPQYNIQNSHPAIVSQEIWDLVQLEFERRRRIGSRYSGKGVLGSKLVCSDCGAFYGSKVWHSNDPHRTVVFQCNDKFKAVAERKSGAGKCITPHVTEAQVREAFSPVCQALIRESGSILARCGAIIGDLLDNAGTEKKIEKLHGDAEKLERSAQVIASQLALPESANRRDALNGQYADLETQYAKIMARIKGLEDEKSDREYRARQAKVFVDNLKKASEASECEAQSPGERMDVRFMDDSWPEKGLFTALVEKVIVSGEKGNPAFSFILRDGSVMGTAQEQSSLCAE